MSNERCRNILDAKGLPHDPGLVATVADRVQSHSRDRAKRGDVVKRANAAMSAAMSNGRLHQL
jgi:hypothetical protein